MRPFPLEPSLKDALALPRGGDAPRLVAVLGPTNTGKTHLAVERMLGFASGMIGLPLRLLAREIYDRVAKARGAASVALITGEEKIIPQWPRYYVCTVEAMPLERGVDFLAVDEIQLCADPERGHVFTHRLLHARGRQETMVMGAATIAPLIRKLGLEFELESRERLSRLSYDGARKLSRLPPRSAIVAFSAEAVYAIAELIRRQRGGAAVVMGALSPRTRNAQVALFQSGEVDFLVATDAIGMGLNMDIGHVAFAGLRKFDGQRLRQLHAHEIGQIGGRAGRFRKDGTFGVTGECPAMDPDLASAVEAHEFQPLRAAEWRNAALDFAGPQALLRSLSAPAPQRGLSLAAEAQDEATLRALAGDETIQRRCRDRANLIRLWDVCQTPDFRKVSQEEHSRLVGAMFEHLTQRDRRLPQTWAEGHYAQLNASEGDLDALMARLARVRTLAYVANRGDWLENPGEWQIRTRELEDRLSDALHERLMQRFVDKRTGALMRSLSQGAGPSLGGIGQDGAVTVEGHVVGKLAGLSFAPVEGGTALENRALRGAVERAVAPEIARRLAELANAPDEEFALGADGAILWRGVAAGALAGGSPFAPKVSLGGGFGPATALGKAARRLERFALAEAARRLSALFELKAAIADGRLQGHARGLAYQLLEGYGVVERRGAREQIGELSAGERRALGALGVRFGAFALFMPSLWSPDAAPLGEAFAALAMPSWRPAAFGLSLLPRPMPSPQALSLRGLTLVGGFAAPVEALERLGALTRNRRSDGMFKMGLKSLERTAWSLADAERALRALGFLRAGETGADGEQFWRSRGGARQSPPSAAPAGEAPRECRLDIWLWRARFCKTRSLAARRIEQGDFRLRRGGRELAPNKPGRMVRPGDELRWDEGMRERAVRIEALGARRGSGEEARGLYDALGERGPL